MEEGNVMDVQLKLEHATHTTAQEIVNGVHIQNGVSVLTHAMEVLKTEQEYCSKPH